MAFPSRIRQGIRTSEARAVRLYADARRVGRGGRSSPGPAKLAGVPRAPLEPWVRATANVQAGYRQSVTPVETPVAVLCSSHRPIDLANVIDSVGCQTHDDLELVFVAHGDGWDLGDTEARLADLDARLTRVTVLSAPTETSLGACLNLALARTSARFVAKFDGDDRYGAEYISDSLRAHALADAGIVGKHTYYAHLQVSDEYLLRFPGHEFEYTSTMSGGTFVIDREIVDDQRFADLSLGEDRDYIRRCHRRGISTFSGDRFNYTVVRSGANTWTIDENQFTNGAIRYDSNWDPAEIDC